MTRYCCDPNCKKQAYFNLPGRTPKFCKDHKTDEMIDIQSIKCFEENCFKQQSYDFPGGFRKYCKQHKLEGMIDIIHPRCKEENCQILASCNYKDLKELLYCSKHKKQDVVDVINKRCDEEACSKQAVCGIPGNKPSKCLSHMTTGQIRRPTRRCNENKCNNIAIFGLNTTATHCDVHKEENQVNLIEGHCSNCGLLSILSETKICEHCGKYSEVRKRLLEKQLRIKDLIQKEEIEIFSYDSVIDKACNKKRPDIVIDS